MPKGRSLWSWLGNSLALAEDVDDAPSGVSNSSFSLPSVMQSSQAVSLIFSEVLRSS